MSESHPDERRLRDAFDRPGPPAEGTPGCPGDEVIWEAARGEADPGTLATLLDHAATCASCAESWRMAKAITDEAAMRAPAAVLPFRRRPVTWAVAAIAAGVFLAAVFLPRMLERPESVPGDEFRDPGKGVVKSLLDEATPVRRDAVVLRWAGLPEGSSYAVELADEELVILHRVEGLVRPEYGVPPEVLAALPSPATAYWRVDATLADGTRVSSAVFVLKLR